MAINVQWIPLTYEQSHSLSRSVLGVLYDLINVEAIFQSFCKHEIFVKLNISTFLVLVRQREKSQKFFDLSVLNENLKHSNL